eukprot:gene3660-4176_t
MIGRSALVFACALVLSACICDCRRRRMYKNNSKWRCSVEDHGKILSGTTCKIAACLQTAVRPMRLKNKETTKSSGTRCPIFNSFMSKRKMRGNKSCIVNGYTYPHGTIVKFNNKQCFACNNGKEVLYENLMPGPDSVTAFTMVRFG